MKNPNFPVEYLVNILYKQRAYRTRRIIGTAIKSLYDNKSCIDNV